MIKGYVIPDPIESSSVELFWDPGTENEVYSIMGPAMKTELNKAPAFEFTIVPSNLQYEHFFRKKTVVRIYDDTDLLFEGRVSSSSTDFYKQKKISCEGAIAYLMDSLQPGDKIQDGTITDVKDNGYHSESVEKTTKETIAARIRRMLILHNDEVEEFKRIYAGEIDAKNEEYEFDSSGYRTTWEAFESDLIDRFGGYMRVRPGRSSDGEDPQHNYLDYLPIERLTGSTSNTMTFGENIIEFTQEESEDDEIFTILLPFGKQIETKKSAGNNKDKNVRDRITIEEATNAVTTAPTDNKEISPYRDPDKPKCLIVSPVALRRYGAIYRCMDFEDRDTPEKLYSRAVEYIQETCGFRNTYEVKAVDMHAIDPSAKERTKIGDRILMKSKWHGINDHSLYVKAAQYDLENPENDSFTIGFPYQEREDKKISSSTSTRGKKGDSYGGGYSGGTSGSNLDNYIKYNDGRLENHTAWISEVVNITTGKSTRLEQDESHISLMADAIIGHVPGESTTQQYNRLSKLEVSDSGIHCIVQIQDDQGNKLVNHESRIEANEDAIQLFTGSMHVEEEGVTFTEVPITSITTTTNPNKNRWWERVDTSTTLDVHNPDQFRLTPDTTVTEGKSYFTKSVDKSKIIIEEGAGMYNEKDRTRYGLWDEGNLTAGILCERINEPEYIAVSMAEKEAAHSRGDDPSTKEPWWYEKDTHGDFIRTTDHVVHTSDSYYFKIAAQTMTQIRGDHIVIGVTDDYTDMDEATKAKVDRYIAENNLNGTITEIASDVVVVNSLIAKYIEADDIVANTSLWADHIWTNHLHSSGDVDVMGDVVVAKGSHRYPEGVGVSNAIKAFGSPTYSGDNVNIPYFTLTQYPGNYQGQSPTPAGTITFTKPASLGAVTWSSGTKTLTAKTVGGNTFLSGIIQPYSPQTGISASYLDTETSGYSTIYGLYYTAKDANNNDVLSKTILFKTPKDRYSDGYSNAVSTVRTRSSTGKFDDQDIYLGVAGISTVYAQYRTEGNYNSDTYTSKNGITIHAPSVRIWAKVGTTEYGNNATISLGYGDSVVVKTQSKTGDASAYSDFRQMTVTAPSKPTISSPAQASAPSGTTPTSLSYDTVYEVHLKSGSTNLANNIYFKTPANNATTHSISIKNDSIDTDTVQPSGTELTQLKAAILSAINEKKWIKFTVSCGGTDKVYKMNFT